MKKLSVTRSTHPVTFKKCSSLGQLITVIEKEGEAEGLYVIKVYLNDKAMDAEEEGLLDSLSINEVDKLTVDLASMTEIIRNTMTDIVGSIQSTQLKAIQFSKEFRQAQSVDDEKVKYILILCRQIIESLEEIFVAYNKEHILLKHMSLWRQAESELTNILQCILQSRNLSGYELISDLIEYDLVHALDQWEEVIEKELVENSSLNGIFSLKNKQQKSDNGVDV